MMKLPEKDKYTVKLPKYEAKFAQIWQNLKLQGGAAAPPATLSRTPMQEGFTAIDIFSLPCKMCDNFKSQLQRLAYWPVAYLIFIDFCERFESAK